MVRALNGYKGLPLEGYLARWYAKITRNSLAEYHQAAAQLDAQVSPGARVLEVAPGPGYLAIELARLGRCRVSGLDISRSFVEMAAANAQQAGVSVEFHQGDAALMPFANDMFDFVICRAAFKNFAQPVRALDEMHRVLRPAGRALIVDLSKDASQFEINAHVDAMKLSRANTAITKWTFKHMLLKRAYGRADFERMAAESAFGGCEIQLDSIALDIWLTKPAA
ncbi:MAG TPA: class I SAM-dependent methyltransferase [Pirellulales bacterium]|jgi:ubiquinone/menaquinone biosynthesis C-methylase UbiE